jgi:hypothetical protein
MAILWNEEYLKPSPRQALAARTAIELDPNLHDLELGYLVRKRDFDAATAALKEALELKILSTIASHGAS